MSNCPLCSNKSSDLIGRNPDFPDLCIMNCNYCGFMWTHPLPSQELLDEVYRETYRTIRVEKPTQEYVKFMDDRANGQKEFIVKNSMASFQNSKILDIGCSSGSLLRTFSGFTNNLVGIEPDEVMAEFAKKRLPSGSTVHVQTFNSEMFGENTFDLITISHLLEHVIDPIGFLSELFRIAGNNSVVFIEIPNESGRLIQEIIRNDFKGLLHLSFFNSRTVKKTIELAGGEIVHMETFGPSQKKFSRICTRQGNYFGRLGKFYKYIEKLSLGTFTFRKSKPIKPKLSETLSFQSSDEGIWIRIIAKKH